MTDHDTDELTLSRREASAFDVVLRGYDREQVEERLLQWSEALTDAEQQRDAALQALAEARRAAEHKSPGLQLSERLKQILVLAEQEAADIRSAAEAEVRDGLDRVRTEADALRERTHADLRRETSAAQAEARQFIADAQIQAREVISAAEEEARDVALIAARTREESVEQHEILLARQREETEQVADQLRQEIVALEQRRDDVRTQLEHLRDALATSVGSLSPPA